VINYLSVRLLRITVKAGKTIDRQELIKQVVIEQHRVSRSWLPYAVEHFKALDIPLAQLKSLFVIAARTNASARMLADDLGVTAGDVTRLIDRLVEQGLANREPDPHDRRVVRLSVTGKGLELLTGLVHSYIGIMSQLLEDMDTSDLEALKRGLAALATAIDRRGPVSSYGPQPELGNAWPGTV
jgi:DNA-binding MarR family transcriptional regulator